MKRQSDFFYRPSSETDGAGDGAMEYPRKIYFPTVLETARAYLVAHEAQELFRQFMKTGHCDPETLMDFCWALRDLHDEAFDFYERMEELEEDLYPRRKTHSEIAAISECRAYLELTSEQDENGIIHRLKEEFQEPTL